MSSSSSGRFDGLPLAVRYSLDKLCTRFEGAWRSGQPPALESCLEQAAPAHQPALMAELLALEIEYRRRLGESPTQEAYLARFPHLGAVIEEAFGPTTPELPAAEGTWSPTLMLDNPKALPAAEGVPRFPRVPGFEVLSELGSGGMGVVYKAKQVGLNRLVALKMIRPRGPTSLQDRMRFRLEAEAVARLAHPNIVQVHDTGEHNGQPYLVLELVEGGSLKQLV